MKKKILIPIAAALAATLSICIFAFGDALIEDVPSEKLTADIVENSCYGVNANAAEFRVLKTSDGEEISLTYNGTHKENGDFTLDVYVDAEENEYFYDMNGELRSYVAKDIVCPDDERDTVSEEYANAVAYSTLKKYFGDKVDEFDYDYTRLRSNECRYGVYYNINFGENGFIVGAECSADIGDEGTPLFAMMRNYDLIKDVDASYLNSIAKSQVREAVKAQSAEKYGDSFVSCHMEYAVLERDEDGFYLKVGVSEKYTNENGETKKTSTSYRYDL